MAAYLTGVGRLSKRVVRTLFAEVCDIPVSLVSVIKLEATVSRALEPTHAATHEATKGADANVDETRTRRSCRQQGRSVLDFLAKAVARSEAVTAAMWGVNGYKSK